MEKIGWTDRGRNKEVLHRVKEERSFLHTITRRKANWIGHILRKKCLLKHFIEGNIERKRRRGIKHRQLRYDLKEKRRYWNLKAEASDSNLWRTRFERGHRGKYRDNTSNYVKTVSFRVL
jgi:hypothetical protein